MQRCGNESRDGLFAIVEFHLLMKLLVHLQACTTDGEAKKSGKQVTDIPSKSCGGTKRMFQWVNSYFIDATAGKCVPRDFRSREAEWCDPNLPETGPKATLSLWQIM